ncbi:hypothetical protein CO614_10235 [Lysobacteraceae bacterium NML120232]|nr:hypothetical protein CO614_10235 [Xanthomonadaceae bacterium NML120232]PJK10268.1 hypothetical protein CO608_06270 [Xanthomonadaceae bacterium NML08-0793]
MLTALLLAPLAASAAAQQTAAPFVVEHTYWLKPGRTEQFISLFKKTRLPALEAERQAGRLLSIRMAQPQLSHGKEQWDFRLTLTWQDHASALQFSNRQHAPEPPSNHRRAMEEQLRDELVVERSDALIIEEAL